MLRYLVAIFFVMNLALFAWMQGWFLNSPQHQGRTPERLQSQERPQIIQVVTTSEPLTTILANNNTSPTPETTPQEPTATEPAPTQPELPPEPPIFSCIEAAPLNGEQSSQLQSIVRQILPNQIWEMDAYKVANSWAVYLGPYANDNAALSKQQELNARGIEATMVRGKPEYQHGVTLGLYGVHSNAENHVSRARQLGITDARIVPWQYVSKGQLLRITEISERQWSQLHELTRGMNLPAFKPCEENPGDTSAMHL
ncbi:MAG: hypothetical protein ACRCWR_03970 [Saezia sp.]